MTLTGSGYGINGRIEVSYKTKPSWRDLAQGPKGDILVS